MTNFTSSPKINRIRILGIDPGLRHTGWAIVEKDMGQLKYIASGVVNTNSKDSMPERLCVIQRALLQLLQDYIPQACSLEETYVNKNFQSSLKLAHSRGVAMVTVSNYGIQIREYPAKTVKKTVVGHGGADKTQLKRMLSFMIPGIQISNDDESDALAIAVCHALHI